jgi:hypothetical protein
MLPFVAPPHAVPPCAVVVPPLTMPPLAIVVPPLAIVVPPLAKSPLPVPPAPLLSCHCLSCRTASLLCWLVVALPCLSLLQCLSRTSWLLNRRLSCCIATSLVALLPLSSRRLSLFTLSLSYCAAPLSLRLSCASDLTSAPAALVYCSVFF